jgi:hypothetical protein
VLLPLGDSVASEVRIPAVHAYADVVIASSVKLKPAWQLMHRALPSGGYVGGLLLKAPGKLQREVGSADNRHWDEEKGKNC